jgi:hypothetical protein
MSGQRALTAEVLAGVPGVGLDAAYETASKGAIPVPPGGNARQRASPRPAPICRR